MGILHCDVDLAAVCGVSLTTLFRVELFVFRRQIRLAYFGRKDLSVLFFFAKKIFYIKILKLKSGEIRENIISFTIIL